MKTIPFQPELPFPESSLPFLTVDEIYNRANQALLQSLREDRRIERKPVGVHADALGEYFSMWANTVPDGGLIAIGIENDGSISGCLKANIEHRNALEKVGFNFAPRAKYETKQVSVRNRDGGDDYVLLVRVQYRPDGAVVRTTKGHAYVRLGDSKKKLTEEEIREFEIDRGQISLELEPCGLTYPDEFDIELLAKYAANYLVNRRLDPDKHDVEDILQITHLGKIKDSKFIPNNACALLFAKDPRGTFPGCKVRFLRFDGERDFTGEKWNAVKDIWIDEGCVPRQIIAVEKALDAQIREFSGLGKDGIFYTVPEYPKEAWYEAVVNACVHRSYGLRNMNIFVRMYDDRLEIESPGGFMPLVTPENIYEMEQPRNPHFFAAMFYLDFVKCAHEGARRIRDSMEAMNLPKPKFEQKEISAGLVRVTLQNDIKHRKVWIDKDASAIVGAAISSTLTDHQRRIINFIAEHGNISVSQAQRLTGKSWPAASKLLKGLKLIGILDDVRSAVLKERDPGARYVLRGSKSSQ